jgi:hypothetical protein
LELFGAPICGAVFPFGFCESLFLTAQFYTWHWLEQSVIFWAFSRKGHKAAFWTRILQNLFFVTHPQIHSNGWFSYIKEFLLFFLTSNFSSFCEKSHLKILSRARTRINFCHPLIIHRKAQTANMHEKSTKIAENEPLTRIWPKNQWGREIEKSHGGSSVRPKTAGWIAREREREKLRRWIQDSREPSSGFAKRKKENFVSLNST